MTTLTPYDDHGNDQKRYQDLLKALHAQQLTDADLQQLYRELLRALYGRRLTEAVLLGYVELTYREEEILETWLQHPERNYAEMTELLLKVDGTPLSVKGLRAHMDNISSKLYTSGAPATLERYRLLRAVLGPAH